MLKSEFSLSKNSYFNWIQLNNVISKAWKENLYKGDETFHDLTFSGHHIIKKYHIYSLSKGNSKELYSQQVCLKHLSNIFRNFFSKEQDRMEMDVPYATLCDY